MLSLPRRWLPWLVAGFMMMPTLMTFAVLLKDGKPWWLALAIPLGIWLVAVPLVRVVIWTTGWDRLARQFASRRGWDDGEPAWLETVVSIGLRRPWMTLNNCVRFACDAQAITMEIERPFRLATPTIRLPWSELGTPQPVRGWTDVVEIVDKAGKPLSVRLFLPAELLRPTPERTPTH